MQIRFAEPKDVSGILNLLNQVGRVHHRIRPDLFREDARKYGPSQLLEMLKDSDTPIFVAEEDGAVLGYGFCIIKKHHQDPVFAENTELYIDDICVDENHRGQNIGTEIYTQILRYAKMRRCYNITLNVWAGNEQAQKFYEKLGLKPQRIFMETII